MFQATLSRGHRML